MLDSLKLQLSWIISAENILYSVNSCFTFIYFHFKLTVKPPLTVLTTVHSGWKSYNARLKLLNFKVATPTTNYKSVYFQIHTARVPQPSLPHVIYLPLLHLHHITMVTTKLHCLRHRTANSLLRGKIQVLRFKHQLLSSVTLLKRSIYFSAVFLLVLKELINSIKLEKG